MTPPAAKGEKLFLLAAALLAAAAALLAPASADASRYLPQALEPVTAPQASLEDLAAGDVDHHPALPTLTTADRLDLADLAAGTRLEAQRLSLHLASGELGAARKTASGGQTWALEDNVRLISEMGLETRRLIFQGLWIDPVSGHSYARRRWLDTRTGAWLSTDDLGPVDSENLYSPMALAPHMATDPMGLEVGGAFNDDPANRRIRERLHQEELYRRYVDWLSANNEAYAYAKSRLPEQDELDERFRGVMAEFFAKHRGLSTIAALARVEEGFPETPELAQRRTQQSVWYGDRQLLMLGAWGEFAESIGLTAAWWAVGGMLGELLSPGVASLPVRAGASGRGAFSTPGRVGRFGRVETPWGRRVWQRSDIDWELMRPEGMTNLEAAQRGFAPLRRTAEGTFERANLHHLGQRPRGGLAEVWESTHRSVPHNAPPPSWRVLDPDAAADFRREAPSYWRWRASQLGGG